MVPNTNYSAYQLLKNWHQQNKYNAINKDKFVIDAMNIYDKINGPKCDCVINALINLFYNIQCHHQIPSTPIIWTDIELLTLK